MSVTELRKAAVADMRENPLDYSLMARDGGELGDGLGASKTHGSVHKALLHRWGGMDVIGQLGRCPSPCSLHTSVGPLGDFVVAAVVAWRCAGIGLSPLLDLDRRAFNILKIPVVVANSVRVAWQPPVPSCGLTDSLLLHSSSPSPLCAGKTGSTAGSVRQPGSTIGGTSSYGRGGNGGAGAGSSAMGSSDHDDEDGAGSIYSDFSSGWGPPGSAASRGSKLSRSTLR